MADANQPLVWWTRHSQRPRIEREDPLQHLLHRPDVALGPALLGDADPVPLGREFMDRQALHDAGKLAHIVGQRVEQGGVAPRVRHRPRAPVEVEQCLSRC
jgi:hypothetical protein